jgi:hypothetical protein
MALERATLSQEEKLTRRFIFNFLFILNFFFILNHFVPSLRFYAVTRVVLPSLRWRWRGWWNLGRLGGACLLLLLLLVIISDDYYWALGTPFPFFWTWEVLFGHLCDRFQDFPGIEPALQQVKHVSINVIFQGELLAKLTWESLGGLVSQ